MEKERVTCRSSEHIVNISGGVGESTSESHASHSSRADASPSDNNHPVQSQVAESSTSTRRSYPEESLFIYNALILLKLTYKVGLIIISAVALVLARHEKPQNPLFAWVMGYILACAASIPVIFRQWFLPHPRLCRVISCFHRLLEFFFAFWFLVGNYWVFSEKSSQANILYRLCISLLIFNYVKYIGPSVLRVAFICCCQNLLNQIGGAPAESINALPIYKFKLKKHAVGSGIACSEAGTEGGVVAAGTERERLITGDDAVCCICLMSYNDDDDLKELPCSHLFHVSCVDTWLRIKAFCPLCKCGVLKGASGPSPASQTSTSQA